MNDVGGITGNNMVADGGGNANAVKSLYLQRVKLLRFATHLIVLVIVFVLPEVLMSWGRTMPKFVYVHTLGYILVFYVNYFLLIDKFLFRKGRVWLYFIINLLFVVCFLFIIFETHYLCFPPGGDMPGKREMPPHPELSREQWILRGLQGLVSRDFVMMVLSLCMSIALKFSERWLKWERYKQKVVAERKEIELKNLKNQLNPHFLFNTLNNIYALIGISTERAQYAVHELSQMLRYVLYESSGDKVPLDKELLFVKNYIELMRLRLSSAVSLKVDIDESRGAGLQIAPLMFIPLVENAFKHGVSATGKSMIDISIGVACDIVTCRVANSCFPKGKGDRSGSGIGLANLRRQLSILYDGRYSLARSVEDGIYTATLEIRLSEKE